MPIAGREETVNTGTIRALIDEASTTHPQLAGRLAHAAMIVVLRRVEPTLTEHTWHVESEREPGRFYTVRDVDGGCTCPDVSRAPFGCCKHLLAVRLLSAAEDREGTRYALTPRGETFLAERETSAPPVPASPLCTSCDRPATQVNVAGECARCVAAYLFDGVA